MQLEHKTEKGTVLFVKVPDDAEAFIMNYRKLCYWFNNAKEHSENYLIQEGNFKLIGLTSEVTEEMANMMVDEEIDWGFKTGFVDYTNRATVCGLSSLDSLKSLMQHLQVYDINPYLGYDKDNFFTNKQEIDFYKAQERTGKFIVLFKPNEK